MPSKNKSKATISRKQAIEARKMREEAAEKELLSLLKDEADAFVPRVFGAVQRRTGLFKVEESTEDLGIAEMLKNEAFGISPDLGKQIMDKVGVKPAGFFSRHATMRRLGFAAGCFLSFAIIFSAGIAISATTGESYSPGAMMRISISPASCGDSTNLETQAAPGFDAPSIGGNPYSPEFLVVPTENGSVKTTGFVPLNLSASYIAESLAEQGGEEYYDISDVMYGILDASYQNGYIEAKTPKSYNKIDISLMTDRPDFRSKFGERILEKANGLLESKKVYCEVNFNLENNVYDMDDLSYDEAVLAYSAYNMLRGRVSFEELLNGSTTVVSKIGEIARNLSPLRVCEYSKQCLSRFIGLTYFKYTHNDKPVAEVQSDIGSLIATLEQQLSALPWDVYDAEVLDNVGFFGFADPNFLETLSEDEKAAYMTYLQIQKAILYEATSSKENYLAFLGTINDFLILARDNPDILPTPQDEPFDPGNHAPGNGPEQPDWGEGSIVIQ